MIARGAEQHLRIAGVAKIGGVSSLGGATMAILDFPVAQRLFGKENELDSIAVAAKGGYTPAQLVREIQPLLPANAQVRTGEAQAKQATKDTNGFLSIIQDLPARVRGRGAVRRRLRDREHAVDHDRPAHARAGDAAHARREPQAGAPLGAGRSVPARSARVGRRAVPRAGAGQGPELAVRARSGSTCRRPRPCSRPGRSWSRLSSGSR